MRAGPAGMSRPLRGLVVSGATVHGLAPVANMKGNMAPMRR